MFTLFMDDLKLYSYGKEALERMLIRTDRVSQAVGMQLGLVKCAVAHMVKGRAKDGGEVILPDGRQVLAARKGNPYKYLLVFEPDLKTVQERLKKLYLRRVHTIWSSGLNGKNKVSAHNAWAVSIFRYYFGIMKWNKHDVDVLTRAVLGKCKSHQRIASKYRLYLPRANGGRGLANLMQEYEREVVSTAAYLCTSADPQLRAIAIGQLTSTGRRGFNVLKAAADILVKYHVEVVMDEEGITNPDGNRVAPKHLTRDLKRAQIEEYEQILVPERRKYHGVYYTQCQ